MNKNSAKVWLFSLLLVTGMCFLYCLNRAVDFVNPQGAFGFSKDTMLFEADQNIPANDLNPLLPYEDVTILVKEEDGTVSVFDPAQYFLFHSDHVQTDHSIPYFSKIDYRDRVQKTIQIGNDIFSTVPKENGTADLSVIDCPFLSEEGVTEIQNLYSTGITKGSLLYVYTENDLVWRDMADFFEGLPVHSLDFVIPPVPFRVVLRDTLIRKKSALVMMLLVSLLLIIVCFLGSDSLKTVSVNKTIGNVPGTKKLSIKSLTGCVGLAYCVETIILLFIFRNWLCLYYSIILLVLWILAVAAGLLLKWILQTFFSEVHRQKWLFGLDGACTGMVIVSLVLILQNCMISMAQRNPAEVVFILTRIFPICLLGGVLLCRFLMDQLNLISLSQFRSSIALFQESGIAVLLFFTIAGIPLFGMGQSLLTGGISVFLLLILVIFAISRLRKNHFSFNHPTTQQADGD